MGPHGRRWSWPRTFAPGTRARPSPMSAGGWWGSSSRAATTARGRWRFRGSVQRRGAYDARAQGGRNDHARAGAATRADEMAPARTLSSVRALHTGDRRGLLAGGLLSLILAVTAPPAPNAPLPREPDKLAAAFTQTTR